MYIRKFFSPKYWIEKYFIQDKHKQSVFKFVSKERTNFYITYGKTYRFISKNTQSTWRKII